MIRILHSVSNMAMAGIETMLMNYYRHMDRDLVQFDFLANKPTPGEYDEEVRSLGGRVFVSPGLSPVRYPSYKRFMKELVRETPELKVVHGHNEAMAYYALKSAQDAGVKVRIAHAHNTRIIRDYKYPLKAVCKKMLPGAATDLWACGTDAGVWYFGKRRWEEKGYILHNAIETGRFAFDPEVRVKMRHLHGLENCFVIGHVGRFNVQKNHVRLLKIFSEIAGLEPAARLVLIGTGELEDKVRREAQHKGIGEKVVFAGQTAEVNEWYQAMDCFVLPSLFEGLPVVGIEAQTAGLPCIFSDRVTDEIILTESAGKMALECSDREWADRILSFRSGHDRSAGEKAVCAAGYDIREEARKLQELYLEMAQRAE